MAIGNETKNNLIQSYEDLLIIQYRDRQKTRDWLGYNVKESVELLDLALEVQNGYDINTAVGKQLDILGKYIGLSRLVLGFDSSAEQTFGYSPYDSGAELDVGFGGFAVYDGALDTNVGTFIGYAQTVEGVPLDDESYRVLLKLKIIKNNTNHSTKVIQTALHDLFPPNVRTGGNDIITMTDNLDMTMTYTLYDPLYESVFNVALEYDIFPRTIGVQAIFAIGF